MRIEVEKWRRLGESLFDISKILKSQQKISPSVFDKKLLRLWCRWEDAFPGRGFNKYHGIFCTLRRYVHFYHMTGRTSEESNEAYNGTSSDIKAVVCCMPVHQQRIDVIAKRTQGNLKREVLACRLTISKNGKGKKRGPYKARMIHRNDRALMSCDNSSREVEEEKYVVLNSGNLLLEKWMDVYE